MSFKFVNDASETCKLENIGGLPSGIGTGVSPTLLFWLKTPGGKYFCPIFIGTDGSGSAFLDHFQCYQEVSGNYLHSYVLPYSGSGGNAISATGWSANTWVPVSCVANLGGASVLKIGSESDVTNGAISAAWHGGNDGYFDRVRLGMNNNNEGQSDSLTAYLAHVVILKRAATSTERGNFAAGDNPLALFSDADIIDYWDGSSLTGYKGTVLSTGGTGTVTYNDADNPTVDAPPGGDVSTGLTGSALTGGHGTQAPSHTITLRERFVSLPGIGLLVPGWLTRRTKFA
ncbi:MAG: hypothetical protein IT349_19300 [Candidatus Eisenbacteria bacterium]|nr:hypothetical protein [Candidatus Eisenbacteria bacterium]